MVPFLYLIYIGAGHIFNFCSVSQIGKHSLFCVYFQETTNARTSTRVKTLPLSPSLMHAYTRQLLRFSAADNSSNSDAIIVELCDHIDHPVLLSHCRHLGFFSWFIIQNWPSGCRALSAALNIR